MKPVERTMTPTKGPSGRALRRGVAALKHSAYVVAITAVLAAAPAGFGTIERLDPALDALVAPGTIIEKVAGGFKFTEGPLWRPDGTLWFSDVPGNVVRSATTDGQI